MSKTIIGRMWGIARTMSEDGKAWSMSMSRMQEASEDIDALCKMLEMNPMQVVILTAVIKNSSRYRIDGNNIADTLGLDYLEFLSYWKELDGLRGRGYIRIDKEGDIVIPKEVLNSLMKDAPLKPLPTSGLGPSEILSRIKRALEIREENQCSGMELLCELDALIEANPDNSVSRTVLSIGKNLSDLERITLFGLIYRYYFEDDDRVGWHDLEDYFEDTELSRLKADYRSGQLDLHTGKYIEYAGDNELMDKDYFRLTTAVKEEIFADVGGVGKKVAKVSASRKMLPAEVQPKELFYNEAEGSQIARLKELLSGDCFDGVRGRMREKGLRSGFSCLFYGEPGTGKTETVYQLARESGRELFIVDVSQIKSCWVGESEKNMKDVFDKYRQAVEAGGTVPILLFNEADAIFGIRQEGAERAVDKMENSMQNIILQEMEDLDGILIATTNLTGNIDRAFERRFLYKVRFCKPSREVTGRIWRSMMPELPETDLRFLAEKFSLSGGQIENIVRKKTVEEILRGTAPDIGEILRYCVQEEKGAKMGKRSGS